MTPERGETTGCSVFTIGEVEDIRKMLRQHDLLAKNVGDLLLIVRGDGNGDKGLNAIMRSHLDREDEREKINQQRHQENTAKLDEINTHTAQKSFWVSVAAVCVSIAAIIVTALGIYIGYKVSTHSFDLPLFHSNTPSVAEQHTVNPYTKIY